MIGESYRVSGLFYFFKFSMLFFGLMLLFDYFDFVIEFCFSYWVKVNWVIRYDLFLI